MSETEIRDRLVREVAEAAGLAPDRIDPGEPFASYGITSIEAVYLVGKLEAWLGVALDPTLFWDHPTIDALSVHLAAKVARS